MDPETNITFEIFEETEKALIEVENSLFDQEKDSQYIIDNAFQSLNQIRTSLLKNAADFVRNRLNYYRRSVEISEPEPQKSIDIIKKVVTINDLFKTFVEALIKYFSVYKKYSDLLVQLINTTKLSLNEFKTKSGSEKINKILVLNHFAQHLLDLIDDFSLQLEKGNINILNKIANKTNNANVNTNSTNTVQSMAINLKEIAPKIQSGIREKIREELQTMKHFQTNVGLDALYPNDLNMEEHESEFDKKPSPSQAPLQPQPPQAGTREFSDNELERMDVEFDENSG